MMELISSTTLRDSISTLQPKAPVFVEQDMLVSDTIEQMKSHKIGCVLVVQNEKMVGIFTERDVLNRVLAKNIDIDNTQVSEVMTKNPECLQLDDHISFALNKMSIGHYRHIPLMDKSGASAGLISVKDVFHHIVLSTKNTTE